jgi:ATP-dependent DNA helicase RecG
VTHRNYFDKGANVMVEMYDDRIEITNPGGLPKGLKPEDFGKKSVLRNPSIANLLQRIGYIEKMGTGITKMRCLIKEADLSPVDFDRNGFFTATLRRRVAAKRTGPTRTGGVFGGVNGQVAERLLSILRALGERPANTPRLVARVGVARRTLERDLRLLKREGLVVFRGAPKTGGYKLTRKAHKLFGGSGE